MVNNINNNTISETLAKQHLNALNEIKKKEIKNKRLINGQKELLNLSDDDVLTILNNSNNNNNNNSNNSNNNEDDSENKSESVNENENESGNEYESENEKDNVNDDDDGYEIKQINNCFKMVYKTKSFEEQINLLRKMHELHEYWHMRYDYDKS